jgi:hypothetical protein
MSFLPIIPNDLIFIGVFIVQQSEQVDYPELKQPRLTGQINSILLNTQRQYGQWPSTDKKHGPLEKRTRKENMPSRLRP